MRGDGGTSGGVGTFLVGLGMLIVGGYLLLTRVTVGSGAWLLWGYNAFGLSLLPLLVGIGWLFFDGKSYGGWILYAGDARAHGRRPGPDRTIVSSAVLS